MRLALELVSSAQAGAVSPAVRYFVNEGGIIGRSNEASLQIRDPSVSRQHAVVRFLGGMFFIEDNNSGNGVSVGSFKLEPAHPHAVRNGDIVHIDAYQFRVTVTHDDAAPAAVRQAPEEEYAPQPRYQPPPPRQAPRLAPTTLLGEEPADPLLLMGRAEASAVPTSLLDVVGDFSGAQRETARPGIGPDLDAYRDPLRPLPRETLFADSPLDQSYRPPPILSIDDEIPAPRQWLGAAAAQPEPAAPEHSAPVAASMPSVAPALMADFVAAVAPEPTPPREAVASPPAPLPAAAGTAAVDERFDGFLAGLGAELPPLDRDQAEALGGLVRSLLDGVLSLLRAQSEMKARFRLPQTQLKRSDNNPYLLSPDVGALLWTMFAARGKAYQSPEQATSEALQELEAHQLALIMALKPAYDRFLARLSAGALEPQFANAARKQWFGSDKAHFWSCYASMIEAWRAGGMDAFDESFGNIFADAYQKAKTALRADPHEL